MNTHSKDQDDQVIDSIIKDKDYYIRENRKLQCKNDSLEEKYEKLRADYRCFKANSLRKYLMYDILLIFVFLIAVPDEAVRSWLLRVANLFSPKVSELTSDDIAKQLGIDKPSILNSCIRDTATNTTRQIIKAMYTPYELDIKRGKDVTLHQRKLIRGKIRTYS